MMRKAKPLWTTSSTRTLIGLRRIASMMASVMCPPSSTGMGRRLSRARLTLSTTLNHRARRQPSGDSKSR